MLRKRYAFVATEEAELIIALGGDGYLLHTLHSMLDRDRVCPVFGMNRGTVGFLMNEWRLDALPERIARAKSFSVAPLEMTARPTWREPGQACDQRGLAASRDPRDRWIEVRSTAAWVLPN